VRTPTGKLVEVILPDSEIGRFLNRVDYLSLRLLAETDKLRDRGLRQVVVEIREAHFRMVRRLGSGPSAPVNPLELSLKVKAFELQLARRLTTPYQQQRYQTLRLYFIQLKGEIQRFYRSIERVIS